MDIDELKQHNDRRHASRLERLQERLTTEDVDELERPLRSALESRVISMQIDVVHALQLIAAARELERLKSAGYHLQSRGLAYVSDTAEYELTTDGLLTLARDNGWKPKAEGE